MLNEMLIVIITTMLPIAELRGGIPLGLALGLPASIVIPLAFTVNCLIFFPIYFGMDLFYERFFERYGWARRLVEKLHKKAPRVEEYGVVALILFVGIPLPVTGAWTGTGIAWLLGLDWKMSFLAVCLGVLMATAIVSLVVFGFLGFLTQLS
ncbi:MAG: small multi-drug export protein [Candidatus Aenigmarchaeota archaeon]|nr:small multi-drug export protein [Candidatus Aenigmarchaeota archaeon]